MLILLHFLLFAASLDSFFSMGWNSSNSALCLKAGSSTSRVFFDNATKCRSFANASIGYEKNPCFVLAKQGSTWCSAPALPSFSSKTLQSAGAPHSSGMLMAERVGFEPTVACTITGFQDQLHKPLGHLSMSSLKILTQTLAKVNNGKNPPTKSLLCRHIDSTGKSLFWLDFLCK